MTRALLEELRSDHSRNFGWALACCGWQQELAEDVLQESYLRVLEGRAEFAGRSTLRTWFFAVVKRVAGETRRTQERRSILNLKLVSEQAVDQYGAAGGSAAEDIAAQGETCQSLQQALLQLSQRQREVLHLVFYSELTLEEAADTLAISVGSARTHYHRGKLQLAQLLNLDSDDD